MSVKKTLEEIKDFVRWCKRDPDLAGFNVRISKHIGTSYILGKVKHSMEPKYVLPIMLDYANPIERPMIANAIYKAIHSKSMTPEALEDEMVCKADP